MNIWRQLRAILLLPGMVTVANMIYIPLREEPGLANRFGDDYLHYMQNVPRWIPRLTPWKDLSE